jgi:hypothetical protein
MTEPTTPFEQSLEQELAELRPVALPAGVRRGVAAKLVLQPPRRPSLVLRFAAAGLAIAACIAVAVVIVRESRQPQVVVVVRPTPATLPSTSATASPAPTLGELRLALARSPEAAEALLSGGGTAKEGPDSTPRAFGPGASHAWPTY